MATLGDLTLDVDTPEKAVVVLRLAAQKYYESEGELQSAWQDKHAGRVWREIGKILERAADASQRAIDKYV